MFNRIEICWPATAKEPMTCEVSCMSCPLVNDLRTKDEVWNFKEELATPLLVGAPREDPREERVFFRDNW